MEGGREDVVLYFGLRPVELAVSGRSLFNMRDL